MGSRCNKAILGGEGGEGGLLTYTLIITEIYHDDLHLCKHVHRVCGPCHESRSKNGCRKQQAQDLENRVAHIHQGVFTAISKKFVGKNAGDTPEWYCGWFLVHCPSKKFERMTREAMDICLRVLKESKKSRFDSCSVRNSILIISHIIFLFGIVACTFFRQPFSKSLYNVNSRVVLFSDLLIYFTLPRTNQQSFYQRSAQSAFYTQSMVRSPQSVFCTDR